MNIHHELIDEYTKDWKITDKPWLLWEHRRKGTMIWVPKEGHPQWQEEFEYRRKPRTIRIGAYDVPEPLRVAPEKNTEYYYVSLMSASGARRTRWEDMDSDNGMLKAGICHLTREAAEIHAKALISLTELTQ